MIPPVQLRKPFTGRPQNYLKQDTPLVSMELSLWSKLNRIVPVHQVGDNELTGGANCICKNGVITKCPGWTEFGTGQPLDGRIEQLIEYEQFDGTAKILAITDKSLYYYNTSSWDAITSNLLAGDSSDFVDAQIVYSENDGDFIVVICNGVDNVKKYNGAATSDLFTGFTAKYSRSLDNFHFYGFIVEGGINYGQQIRWADIGKPEVISTGLSGAIFLSKTSDLVTGFGILRGALAVFKERSISLATTTGNSTMPVMIQENVMDIGTRSPKTIANIDGDTLIWLGNDKDVYITDGSQKVNVSKIIRPLLGDRIDENYIVKVFGKVLPTMKWYILSIPTTGNTEPNETWVFDYEDMVWYPPWTAWDGMTAFVDYIHSTGGVTIGSLTGSIGSLLWKIGDLTSQSRNKLIGTDAGHIYREDTSILSLDGSSIAQYFDTKNFTWDNELTKRITEILSEASGNGTLNIYYSLDEGVTWNLYGSTTLTNSQSEQTAYKDLSCQRVMFRFRHDSTDGFMNFRKAVIKRIDKSILRV
jgi:hypothetical protein